MNKRLAVLLTVAAVTVGTSAAPAAPSPAVHSSRSTPAASNDMVGMCSAMMSEMMADPVMRKRMNDLMRKHMSKMMQNGTMHGAGMMNDTHGGMMGGAHGGMMGGSPGATPTGAPPTRPPG